MKYSIDRIIDNIVILENIETGSKLEITKQNLPFSIHEGLIIIYKDGLYIKDETEEEKRRRIIEEKFKRLRNN